MPRRKVLIKSGYHLRKDCPIYLFLKEKVNGARLIDEEDKEIACQIEKNEKGSFLFWIVEHLAAGKEKAYTLITSRIIDFEINFQATEGNIKFGDTKEGGILSIRVNPVINADKSGLIENAYGGVNEKETWGKRAHWCDYSGEVEGEKVGLAIFDHPENFRYPTYWHVRNYGLMTANPFALSHYYNDPRHDGSYVLSSGKNLVFRYRLFVHSGNTKEGKVSEAYHNYINPPEVLIV